MNKNENHELVKTMFKCGVQLLMVAGVIAIIFGIAKVTTFYAANLWSAVLFVNNLFLPSKHFIQDNIWYFVGSLSVFILWLTCVFMKTPKEHVSSLTTLTKLLAGVLVLGDLLMFCAADMNEGVFSGFLFILAFILFIASWAVIHDLMDRIADTKLKQIKEKQ